MKKSQLIRAISITILILVIGSALSPVWAQAKQVVVNGDFETDVSGWSVVTGAFSRTTTVVHTGNGSGQLDLADAGEGGLYAGDIYQCIDLSGDLADWPVSGAEKYITFSGMVKTDAGDGSDAFFWIQFWANADCSSYVSGQFSSGTANQDWTEERHTMEIPISAQSIRVWVMAEGTATSGPVYVDELRAFSSTPTAVTVQHFGVKQVRSMAGVVFVVFLMMTGVVWGRRPFSPHPPQNT